MKTSHELFIGITTYNDEQWIGVCLSALRRTLQGVSYQLVVLDNKSSDRTFELAREQGAEALSCSCNQGEALNILLERSRAAYTLLMHSDVVMLHRNWFDLVRHKLDERIVLVSPNDIGLGNYLRHYGAGKPESSFLFFATNPVKALRKPNKVYFKNVLQKSFVHPLRHFDFYGPHVTHRIPQLLDGRGKGWCAMDVLPSQRLSEAWFRHDKPGANWDAEWGYFDYGFGNFYSLDGVVTHYHNWYSRQLHDNASELNSDGTPLAYIRGYSQRFLNDFQNNRINVPNAK